MNKPKKNQKPLPKISLSPIKGFGGGLRDILVAAATHPATAGLAVMALTVTVKLASGAYKESTPFQRKLSGELTGMYNGAQGLALASTVVPVAVGAINLAQSALTKAAMSGQG